MVELVWVIYDIRAFVREMNDIRYPRSAVWLVACLLFRNGLGWESARNAD